MAKIAKPHLLVVGGTGFIGYHLVLAAKKKGWKVSSISLNKPKKYRYVKDVNYLKVDIANLKKLEKKLNQTFTYVVNLGGYGKHSSFGEGGDKIIKVHFLGLVNLIKVLNRKKPKKFIQIGSSVEYGEAQAPQKESFDFNPSVASPYALAKSLCTQFLRTLYKTEKYPVTILRFFLVYGPKQDENRILPQIIKGCLKNKKFNVSKGSQIRDFCFIDDVINAIFLTLKSRDANGKIFNIGSGKPKKIKTVINQICKIIGKGKPQFGKIKYKIGENMNLYPSIKKARIELKWKPKVNFNYGLKIVINSYKR